MRRYLLFFPEDSDEGMEVHGPFASAELRRLELGGYVDHEGVAADHPHAIYLDVSDDGSPIIERVTEAEAWRAWEDFHIEAQAALVDEAYDRWRDEECGL